MSFRAEVIADDSGLWYGNGLRFATWAEASAFARDLHLRWTRVKEVRVVEDGEAANYRWTGLGVEKLTTSCEKPRADNPEG